MARPRLLESTRARVLVGALLLLALTIVVSVVVDRAVLLARLDERIDGELSQEVNEFRRLSGGIDPDSGEPFGDSVERIFDTYFDRNVPGEDEVFLAILAGDAYARTANAPYPIDELDDLVAAWGTASEPAYRSDDTPAGRLRSLAVPISGSDGALLGTFVVARFPAGEREEVDDAIRVASTVGFGVFVVAAGLAWLIAGRVLQPLRTLADTAASIGEDDFTRRIPIDGSGELAELTRTFNAMLDRVEATIGAQRAFLDDAGHELRTPITVLRGHLELAEPDDPLTESTRDIVLDELDRMSRIVDDLLVMAKAEQEDFIRPGPVDIDDLTQSIVDKARPLAQREWRSDAISVVADIDRERITQAWMNLVRNAVQHTETGDRITVYSRRLADHLELGVVDTGEGVAAEDRERIFQRFARGRSTRRTRSDGAGLGLPITSAIATGHGGSIELHDTPGGGATFTMRLPWPVARTTPEDDGEPMEETSTWPES